MCQSDYSFKEKKKKKKFKRLERRRTQIEFIMTFYCQKNSIQKQNKRDIIIRDASMYVSIFEGRRKERKRAQIESIVYHKFKFFLC